MKLSRTAIKELTAAYRAVLKHALIASMGAVVVMPAMAETLYATAGETKTNEEESIEYSAYVDEEGAINPALKATGANAILNIGKTSETTKVTLTQEAKDDVVRAMKGGKIYINADEVNITSAKDGLWAQNSTQTETDKSKIAEIDIKAGNLTIKADDLAIVAMSQGIVNIDANATIEGRNAILARGYAQVTINASGDKTVKMNGDIDFDYNKPTSGTSVDATVDVTLNGEESVWNGNTVVSYDAKPDDSKLVVSNATLKLQNGATWNATQIEDNKGESEGSYYTALNNLKVDKGTVNILDTDRGITIDEGTIANAIFTGGTLNVNDTLTVTGGENVFAGDIRGEDAMVDIQDGATLNIGDASINVDTVKLDGNMIANLSDRGDKAIVTADEFKGNGKMSLIAKGEGEYKVFGGAAFAGEKEINSVLYHLDWKNDGKTVKLGMKSVQDIAADNNLTSNTSQTVLNLIMADSDKLNDFGLLIQEHLSNRDVAAVEKAHKVINPAEVSAVQSVTSNIQGTVTKLAANRMSVPTITTGHSGGDVDLTAGGVWAQGLFNKSKKNGEFNGYTRGVAAGIDGTINRAFTIGAGYAFNHSDMDLDSRDTEIDSNTIFVYGQYKPSAWYANATLNYTMSDYEESGSALGLAVKSDYKINAFGGQVMTGYDFANGLTPEMGVRYLHVGGDTYTNSLGIKNKIDDADYLTAILGGKYAKVFEVSRELSVRPEVRLAAKYDMLSDEYDTAVAMPGINSYSVRSDSLNRFGGEAGLGVTMSYKDVDLSLTYDIEVRKDYTSQTGMVKARYNF